MGLGHGLYWSSACKTDLVDFKKLYALFQLAIAFLKLTIETLEQGKKYVQNYH